MSAIEAATAGFKDMADGTVRFFFDVEPRHAGAALELFRVRGTPAALAALKVGYAQASDAPEPKVTEQAAEPEPNPTKLGPLAFWLVLRCNEPEFWEWMRNRGYDCKNAKDAADHVKNLLGLQSRKDLDGNPDNEANFHSHIRAPYAKWCAARGFFIRLLV